MRDQACSRPAHLFYGELDPEVVAELAIIEGSHNPRYLGALRVVVGMVVPTVVNELLHARGPNWPEAQLTKYLLSVMFDDLFGPHGHVVRVLVGGSASAPLAE